MKRYRILFILLCFYPLFGRAQSNVVIAGKIKNYKNLKNSHVSVWTKSLALGDDVTFSGKVNIDGSFKLEFPFYHAQDISFEFTDVITLLVKPGDNLFIEFDADSLNKTAVFSGAGAALNALIVKYNIDQIKYWEHTYGSLKARNEMMLVAKKDSAATTYKNLMYKLLEVDKKFFSDFTARNLVPDIFKAWAKSQMEYGYGVNLMEYASSANKLKPPSGYFDFFERFPLNNTEASIASNYGAYLAEYNNGYFLPNIKATQLNTEMSVPDVAKALLKAQGLTKPQKNKLTRLSLRPADAKPGLWDMVSLLSLQKLANANQELITAELQPKAFAKLFNVYAEQPNSFSRDVLLSNIFYKIIEAKYLDAAKAYLDKYRQVVKTDFMKSELLAYYNTEEQKFINYKLPVGANVIIASKSESDTVFNDIISKYKGKVVYVDFWATWCGPCREEMPASAILRKNFENKNVVFVYLGVQSPEKSWKAVIGELNIIGDNYLLKDEDYKVLQSQFQINGIPHYVLVDKNGKIKDDHAKGPADVEEDIIALLR